MAPAPRLPFGARAMNRAHAAVRGAGLELFSLAPEKLLAAARRRARKHDFGPGPFREGLLRYTEALEREARLTGIGRMAARRDLVRLLANRLHVTDTLARHPEIEQAGIRRPLFLLGLPRTGTSILHELLAQDPGHRVPVTWEVMHPFPPPDATAHGWNPRIDAAARQLDGVDRLIPGFKAMHPMGARFPQECVAITAHEMASMMFHTTHRVPSYQAWLDGIDWAPVYAGHRRFLQYLQWKHAGVRWVLKSPGHLWTLDALLDAYPDALIVQTHRDPLRVVASLASLVTTLRGLAADGVDPREIGADWTERLHAGLEHSMRVRDARGLGPDRVLDLRYSDFVGNELASVRGVYERFGLELTADAAFRIQEFLRENPKDKHGAHRYTLADAGLDPATERRRYAAYRERFEIPEEPE